MGGRYVVLVTGGSGCLGQHIIKFLQTRADHVDEIRVLDIVPFVKKLDYDERVHVTSICDDISKMADTTAFEGVTSVFHLASIISVSNFPDVAGSEKINVKGTEAILEACVKENVSRLIYCSTVDVVCGYSDIVNGTEEDTAPPDHLIYPTYAGTKQRAERMVLGYDGKRLKSGAAFQTVSLRPTVFYGELDTIYVPNVFGKARANGGVFVQVGDGSALYQQSYVGNIAWAFICAEKTLRTSGESPESVPTVGDESLDSSPTVGSPPGLSPSVSGEAFFITDDAPPRGMSQQVQPFLEAAGCCLSSYKLPFYPIYGSIRLTEGLLWLLSPLVKVDLGFSAASVRYTNTTFTFSCAKARKQLGYSPIFTPQESYDLSNKYYLGLLGGDTKRK